MAPEDFLRVEWFTWQQKFPERAKNPQTAFEAGAQLGAWRALKSNTDLGLGFAIQNLRRDVRALGETLERLERLAEQNREHEIDAELEAQSAYWHTEVDS